MPDENIGVFEPDRQEDAEKARLLFARPWSFVTGARHIDQLPEPAGAEVAFVGRSNVGKSSLINALTGQKGLARISNTPGRTREINFFASTAPLLLVDLPGYGFASAPKAAVKDWNRLIHDYLRGRANLARVYLLIDARHGLKGSDAEVLDTLDHAAVSYQGVMTKADKLLPMQLRQMHETVSQGLSKHPAAHPQVLVTSAQNRGGLDELRAAIAELVPAD